VTADLVVASNRGPLSFELDDDGLPVPRNGAGGLAPSLASALSGSGAVWIASALTEGDRRAAGKGQVDVDGVSLRLLDLPDEVQRAAYNVVANGTLWFLQHDLYDRSRRPVFDRSWYEAWEAYRAYNSAFAGGIAELAGEGATVLVHDYHLGLCGRELAALRPDLRTVHFTHTPWCEPRDLAVLPDHAVRELLDGMAGFGACGFHTERWAAAYSRCAGVLGTGSGAGAGQEVFASPLGVDSERLLAVSSSPECLGHRAALDKRLKGRRLLLRSDRVELSKNLVRGFRAFGSLLERRRDLHNRVVFMALAYGSREQLPEYLAYRNEVEHMVDVVNSRFATAKWKPVELDVSDDFVASVAALTRYDVLLVNPLRDGLNLVAAEGPLVNEVDGVLALSREAGAFDLLGDAVLEVHPYDVVQTAAAIEQALDMGPDERADRAARLRSLCAARTPASWLADLVAHARPPSG
jgi:trehalose 6-phosphate synthase